MSWMTDKNYVVFKDEQGRYCWDYLEYMLLYKNFDLFIPILYTNRISVAQRVWLNLNNHEKRQAR